MRKIIIVVFALFLVKYALGQTAQYTWPLPDKWTKEVIPFPLNFAPALDYRGVEEIHFMPGWSGKESKEQLWSYCFFWLIDGQVEYDAERLEEQVAIYFDGLAKSVLAGSGKKEVKEVKTRVGVAKSEGSKEAAFTGKAEIPDMFFTFGPITLHAKVQVKTYPAKNKTLVFFEFSPQPYTHKVWKLLDGQVTEFRMNELFPGNKFYWPYSYLSASIGLSRAAFRAGYQPKKIPIAVENRNASRMD
jgi:hypothetical protein